MEITRGKKNKKLLITTIKMKCVVIDNFSDIKCYLRSKSILLKDNRIKNKRFVVTVQKAMVEAYYPLKDKLTWDI